MEKDYKKLRIRNFGNIIIPVISFFMLTSSVFAETINLEAESYSTQSGCQLSTGSPGYSGSGFMDYGGAGSYVEWNVNVSSSGDADFSFTYASGDVNNRNCDLIVNGVNVGNVDFPGTGAWDSWQSTSKNNIGLTSGTNIVRLYQTGSAGPNLDKVDISLTPQNNVGSDKEAENYTSQNGCAFSSANPGFSGTGFMDYGGDGTWLEWNNVNVTSSGSFTLTFQYANGSTSNRQCQLLVNGVDKGNIAFNYSGGWSTWATVSSASISLDAGNNTIRLIANTGNGGPNLDMFEVVPGGPLPDPEKPTPPTNLAASNVNETSFTLTWTASSSNVGVAGYEVFRNGVSVGNSTNNSKTISDLTCNTSYSMTVKAYDVEGNWSDPSSSKSVNTTTCSIEECTTSEAESGYSGSSVVVASSNPGYTGSGFLDYGGQNSYAEWSVSAATAGSYTFKFRYANGSSGNRQCELKVNASNQGNLAFAPTGNWANWGFAELTVNLSSGSNTIRLTANTSSGGPNLDNYEVCGDTPPNPESPTAPTNLVFSNVTENSFTVSWTASTDDVGVVGYHVFFGDIYKAHSSNTDETINNLTPSTDYSVKVRAYDTDGNFSDFSASKTVTTLGDNNPRARKLGTNLWYLYSDNGSDGTTWTGAAVFKQNNPDFANTSNPWRDEFINNMKIYQVVRFMDWGVTNYMPGSDPEPPLTTWNQRTLKGDPLQMTPTSGRILYDQGGGRKTAGIAYEWMMDLCNRIESDMWICIPHATIDPSDFPNGDDFQNEFVHKLAILLKHGVDMGSVNIKNAIGGKNNLYQLASKDRQWFINKGGVVTNDPLKSQLKIYIEYSNELWMRGQNDYARNKASQLGLSSYYRFGAWADIRMWKAFKDVFGSDSRIVKVGGHSTWVSSEIHATFNDVYNKSQYNIWNIQPDAWKYQAYVNPGHYAPGDPICGNSSNLESKWYEEINVKINNNVKPMRQIINSYGVDILLGYEGGQHFDCNGGEFARNPLSYELMWNWADMFTGSDKFDLVLHYCHYGNWPTNSGGISSWGAMDDDLQSLSDAHKYRGLKDWVEGKSNPKSATIQSEELELTSSEKGTYIYPNPSTNGQALNIVSDMEDINSFQIVNLSGQIIFTQAADSNEDVYQLNPDVSLESGIYFVIIKSDAAKKTIKYVIGQ